eukprot:tig00020556_g10994.t1
MRQLCRLRRVCRRFAELVEAGGAAPCARLPVLFDASAEEPEKAATALEQGGACASAVRAAGVEELALDVTLRITEDEVFRLEAPPEKLPAFSLAPLAGFRSLRALCLRATSLGSRRGFGRLAPEHVEALAGLPHLSGLDLRGLSVFDETLAPLRLAALRAEIDGCLLEDVVACLPALERLALFFERDEPPPREQLARLSSLRSLRALSLVGGGLPTLAPLAALSSLEHLTLGLGFSTRVDLARPRSPPSLDLGAYRLCLEASRLAPLTRLEALRLRVYALVEPAGR